MSILLSHPCSEGRNENLGNFDQIWPVGILEIWRFLDPVSQSRLLQVSKTANEKIKQLQFPQKEKNKLEYLKTLISKKHKVIVVSEVQNIINSNKLSCVDISKLKRYVKERDLSILRGSENAMSFRELINLNKNILEGSEETKFLTTYTWIENKNLSSSKSLFTFLDKSPFNTRQVYFPSQQFKKIIFPANVERVLTSLNLSDNQIESLNLERCEQLKFLFLRNNPIKQLKIGKTENLLDLDLSNTEIAKVSKITKKWFTHTLGLSEKQISRIEKLLLSNNNLEEFEYIGELDFNKWYSELDLSHNKLKILDPNIFKGCRKLHLSHNDLKNIDFESLKSASEIDLSKNRLSRVYLPFAELPSIQTVNLSDNQIEEITFKQPSSRISLLDVSNNKIKKFEFKIASNISNINLSKNSIELIDFKDIEEQRANIPSCAYTPIIDLSDNQISLVLNQSPRFFQREAVYWIKLKGNPILEEKNHVTNQSLDFACEMVTDIVDHSTLLSPFRWVFDKFF